MSSEEEEFDGEEEEEESGGEQEQDEEEGVDGEEEEGGSPPRRKRKAVDYRVDESDDDEDDEDHEDSDDEDDDEDDVPLISLKKSSSKDSKKAKPSSKAKKKPAASSKKKAKPAPKSPTKASASSSSKSNDYLSTSSALYDSGSKKGLLIQKLLCRWWYAIEWPVKAELPEDTPDKYDKLDGFEGVYVCTSGDKVGKILDLRSSEDCPSFQNFAKKSSKELKELLLKALEAQKQALIEAEGEGTPTEKEIKDDIKTVKRIKVDEADKEANKVLKAAKMKL